MRLHCQQLLTITLTRPTAAEHPINQQSMHLFSASVTGNMSKVERKLSDGEISRIVEMAWEDRTPFDAIESQFQVSEDQVIKLMRGNITARSFKRWRERVTGRKTKHTSLRDKSVTRHQSSTHNKANR